LARASPAVPTHRLYHVTGEGKDARWRDIGAAWQHKDGKGYSVSCPVIPLTGRIVMREATEKPKADTGRAHSAPIFGDIHFRWSN
jgi:hypothetical protein